MSERFDGKLLIKGKSLFLYRGLGARDDANGKGSKRWLIQIKLSRHALLRWLMKQHQDISDKWYGRNGKDKRTGSDYLTTIGVKANYSEMWLTPVTGPLRLLALLY